LPRQRVAQAWLGLLLELPDKHIKRGRGPDRPAFRTYDRAGILRARMHAPITQHQFEFACDAPGAVARLRYRPCHAKAPCSRYLQWDRQDASQRFCNVVSDFGRREAGVQVALEEQSATFEQYV